MNRLIPLMLLIVLFNPPLCILADDGTPHPQSARQERILYDFQSGHQNWEPVDEHSACRATPAPDDKNNHTLIVETNNGEKKASASTMPAIGAHVQPSPSKANWHPYTHLILKIYVPEKAPRNIQPIVHIKDTELNYYQYLHKQPLAPGSWTTLRIDLTTDSPAWSYRGHYKPWDGYCRQNVREVGVKFQSPGEFNGPVYVDTISLRDIPHAQSGKNAIYNLRPNTTEVGKYDKFELSFNLSQTYSNPFDPDIVQVTAHINRPDGSVVKVPGFFYQAYRRRMSKRTEKIIPQGRSHWKIRFAPTQTGKYEYYIKVSTPNREDSSPIKSNANQFHCVESNRTGFVRISDKDKFYFETDDGSFYYPIGHNIAAVHDARATPLQVNIPASEGTYAYDRILTRMGEAGENWGRVWMSPWNFGLEWTHAYDRHYRGRGRYNLQNAWKLDHVLQNADRNDIRILLLFTAHGEIADYESDFKGHDPKHEQGHPYWSKYGGPADSPRDLYTSEKAKELYHKKLRYIVARWSYSTAIMGWEILNEADLASFYKNEKFGKIGADFVADAANHVRDLDPAKHLITSSVFRYRRPWSEPLLRLQELDFNTGHIFHGNLESKLRSDTHYMQETYNKIFLTTEAGLTPFAQDAETTTLAIHRTLWSSFMIPSAGTAAPWWWVLIDRRNLYSHFHALSKFAQGEDRRNKNFRSRKGIIKNGEDSGRDLHAIVLKNENQAFCWAFNKNAFSSRARWEAASEKPAKLSVQNLQAGNYLLEIWDTYTGDVIETISASSNQTNASDHETLLTFNLPPFARDIAVKIKPE